MAPTNPVAVNCSEVFAVKKPKIDIVKWAMGPLKEVPVKEQFLIDLATEGDWRGVKRALNDEALFAFKIDARQDRVDPSTKQPRQGRHTTLSLALLTLREQTLNQTQKNFLISIIEDLVERKADVNFAPWGEVAGVGKTTVMHLAAGQLPFYLFERMVERGGDIYQIDSLGANMLHWAAAGAPPILKYLLDSGLDPLHANLSGRTPVQVAVASGEPFHLQVLRDYLDPQFRDVNGNTLMMTAAQWLNEPNLNFLLSHKVGSLDQVNKAGDSALHMVASLLKLLDLDFLRKSRLIKGDTAEPFLNMSKNVELEKALRVYLLLLENGADQNLLNQKGQSAIDLLKSL